jgi:two-component system, chemotaxis family, protein-glutamate methylesterase/glutaminase
MNTSVSVGTPAVLLVRVFAHALMARDIVVIGASAGGFDALKDLFRGLPAQLAASVLAVLHISPYSNSHLPQLFSRLSALPVSHPRHGETIQRGHIYIAPPNHHLRFHKGHMELDLGPKENRHRPAVDVLFRSAAYQYGPRVIGVILSGALDDGTAGLWEIKKHGGIAIVQNPEDALYPSMPFSAMRSVQIDYAVPLSGMAELITSLCTDRSKPEKTVGGLSRESEP